jgi:NitT/TauT family transport system permease protein
MMRRLLPLATLIGLVVAWEALVRLAHIPHYTLPAPTLVLATLIEHFGSLAAC